MRLTEHFKLSEFTNSSTATARGIDNTPNEQQIANLKRICEEILEPLRAYANESSPSKGDKRGSVPIIIGSGYRSPALNKAVGGVPNSQHQTGEAVDIHIPDEATGRKWFLWMMDNLKFDQLIMEKSTPSSTRYWIHVAFKRTGINKQQVIHNLIKYPSK